MEKAGKYFCGYRYHLRPSGTSASGGQNTALTNTGVISRLKRLTCPPLAGAGGGLNYSSIINPQNKSPRLTRGLLFCINRQLPTIHSSANYTYHRAQLAYARTVNSIEIHKVFGALYQPAKTLSAAFSKI